MKRDEAAGMFRLTVEDIRLFEPVVVPLDWPIDEADVLAGIIAERLKREEGYDSTLSAAMRDGNTLKMAHETRLRQLSDMLAEVRPISEVLAAEAQAHINGQS